MADQYTPRPPKQGAVSGSGGGHLVRTPPLPPASPSDELLSGELPDHVNAEQEAGRKAVASARNQTMAEQEAGRKAMEQSKARGGRPPPRGSEPQRESEPSAPSRSNPLHGNQE